MPLQNPWVSYTTRSYAQIKQAVLTDMQTAVPEITDHTEGNLFVKIVDIHAGLTEMLGYYVDNAAREAFVVSCRLYASGIKLARGMDYRPHAKLSASVDIVFTLDAPAPSNISIPAGTEIADAGSTVSFFTTANAQISTGQTTVTVPARQATTVTGSVLGTSDGTESQVFALDPDLEDESLTVRVNALGWTGKTTLGFSIPTDEHFVQAVDENAIPTLRFGNNFNGKIPPNGQTIDCDYRTTLGAVGNVASNILVQIVSVLTIPVGYTLTCTNTQAASGGASVETLAQLRRRIPLANRTLFRAVTYQDYIDVAELCPGVARAGVIFNCGKDVEIYIVPDGGGIASTFLIATCQAWMDDHKMLTTSVVVKSAGEVHILFNIDVRVLPQYANAIVGNAVQTNLAAFMSYLYQQIAGSVELSDIYEIIETTPGVNSSLINLMTPVPYARPMYTTTAILAWTRVIQAASNTTIRWEIIMTSGTTFQLMKNNIFVGNFTVGNLIAQTEIVFTVLAGTYAANDRWEFYTYPYTGTIQLTEPSLPISLAGDITINASGGT